MPAQKISLGHHSCTGGKADWFGRSLVNAAEGEATAVDTVKEGKPVLVVDAEPELEAICGCGNPRAPRAAKVAPASRRFSLLAAMASSWAQRRPGTDGRAWRMLDFISCRS